MKTCKKLISVLMAIVVLVCFMSTGMAAYAATPATQTIEVYPGDSVNIPFSIDGMSVHSKSIAYSNASIFEGSIQFSIPTPGMVADEEGFINESTTVIEHSITYTRKVKSTAAIGSTCVVTFTYDWTGTNILDQHRGSEKKVTVKVVDRPTTSTPAPTTSTVTSKPVTSTPTSSTPAVQLNLTELNKQIGIAQGLNASEYTADSLAKVKTALSAAISARKATKQADVDAAAKALKDAIAALVKVDGTQLQALIDEVTKLLGEDSLIATVDALEKALAAAQTAIISGKQEEINAAYTALNDALQAYKEKLEEQKQTIEVEKPVEVEPDGPFCNLWLHKLWLILLIVSLCANAVFIALTVRYFVRRKNQNDEDDNTPIIG